MSASSGGPRAPAPAGRLGRPDAEGRVDLAAIARAVGCDLPAAFAELKALYDEVDARNAANTASLDLPCHRGCSMCCHESVFLTALEFFYAWDYVQRELPSAERAQIVRRGLLLYREWAAPIAALEAPPPPGARDHLALARTLRFACPMLAADGACRIYPARELLARLFGASFNEQGGVYGCHLVAQALGTREVTLLKARPWARRASELPLGEKRQIYPYWIHLLYGAEPA